MTYAGGMKVLVGPGEDGQARAFAALLDTSNGISFGEVKEAWITDRALSQEEMIAADKALGTGDYATLTSLGFTKAEASEGNGK